MNIIGIKGKGKIVVMAVLLIMLITVGYVGICKYQQKQEKEQAVRERLANLTPREAMTFHYVINRSEHRQWLLMEKQKRGESVTPEDFLFSLPNIEIPVGGGRPKRSNLDLHPGSDKIIEFNDDYEKSYYTRNPAITFKNIDMIDAELVTMKDEYEVRNGVHVQFTPEATTRLKLFSKDNIDRQIAVVIDGKVILAPVIRDILGSIILTGYRNFTPEEAMTLGKHLLK